MYLDAYQTGSYMLWLRIDAEEVISIDILKQTLKAQSYHSSFLNDSKYNIVMRFTVLKYDTLGVPKKIEGSHSNSST